MKRIYWFTSFFGIFLLVTGAFLLTKKAVKESLAESLSLSCKPVLSKIAKLYGIHGDGPDFSSKKVVSELAHLGKSSGADWIGIYSTDGKYLFSSGKKAHRTDLRKNETFLAAAQGVRSASLSYSPFSFFNGGRDADSGIFSLYVPIRRPGDKTVAGVLEAGKDVTFLLKNISERGARALGLLAGFLLLLHLAIFYIIKRHNRMNEEMNLETRKHGFSFFKYYDGLTRLPNRLMFMENLTKLIDAEREAGKLLGVMYIGIDRLKMINDGLGHEAGNIIILEIVKRLRECTRGRDVLSRMSGDEFAIVCEGELTRENMEMVAERIMRNVRKAVNYEGREVVVTSSVGFALFKGKAINGERLVENANIAMRNSKRLGGNRFEFYSESVDSQSSAQLELQVGLWNAVEKKEFVVFYQPKVNTFTGEVIGMEALLRWIHPNMGLVSPSRFIPLLEETGLMVPVGDWMIIEACRQTKKWHDEGYKNLRVSVNLSMCQFLSSSLVDNVKKALEKSGLPPTYLELELTESLLADDVERTVASLGELKALGIRLSLDDFGTGYSSLSHITRFPIDVLKVDRAFIKDVTANRENATLTTAIVALAKSLHLEIVAEGVETLDHFNFVKDLGCDEIQGFFFSAPVPSEGFKSALKNIEKQTLAMVV